MILQGPGHDLRGAGAVTGGQHHQRHVDPRALGLGDVVRLVAPGPAAGEDHQLALLEEEIRHRERLVEKPTRVVPDVEHEGPGALGPELLERSLQLPLAVLSLARTARGGLVEVGQADVAHARADHERVRDRVQRDRVTDDRELQGVGVPFADDGDLDRRPLRAPEPLDRVVDAHPPGVLALDSADHVTGPDAEPVSRSPLEGGHHRDVSVDRLNADPEAVVLALLALLHLLVGILLEEVRVRIQGAEHLADGGRHQAVGRHLLHVVALDGRQHRGVQPELVGQLSPAGENPVPEEPPGERAPNENHRRHNAQSRELHESIIAKTGAPAPWRPDLAPDPSAPTSFSTHPLRGRATRKPAPRRPPPGGAQNRRCTPK